MSYLTRRIAVQIVLLASIICAANVFAGDDIAEIEAALALDAVRKPGPRTNTRSLLGTSVNNDDNTFWATGELNIIRGGSSGGTIDLYFDVPLSYITVSSIKVTMNAYDVDYPRSAYSDVEHDKVYFNGTYIGRLRGGDVVWQENTFEVPKELLNPGRNSLHIDVNVDHTQAWVTSIGWARLVIDGYVMELFASDGEDSHGIDVTWGNIGGPYTLYRATGKNGDFKPIPGAESLDKNSYTDTNIKYGQAYWYYVVTSSNQTSSKDSGYAKIDSDEPRIESIKCASLWLTGTGPYNMRLYWNKFNGDKYPFSILKIKIKATKTSYQDVATLFVDDIIENSKLLDDGTIVTDIDISRYLECGPIPNGSHGPISIIASASYGYNAQKFNPDEWFEYKDTSAIASARVYFHKFEKVSLGISNWFRYWHRDGAITGASIVDNVIHPSVATGRFCSFGDHNKVYFFNNPINRSTIERGNYCSGFRDELKYHNFPIIGTNYQDGHIYVTDYGAAHGGQYKIQRDGREELVGESGNDTDNGIYRFAQEIAHEGKHKEIENDLFRGVDAVIYRERRVGTDVVYENLGNLIEAVGQYVATHDSTDLTYLAKLFNLRDSGNYRLDSDGDGIENDKETSGEYGIVSDPYHPDSLRLGELNNIYPYKTYGDNEVCARLAEKTLTVGVNESSDWAYPGCNIAREHMWRYPTDSGQGWNSCSGSVSSALWRDCFNEANASGRRYLSSSPKLLSSNGDDEASVDSECNSGVLDSLPIVESTEDEYPVAVLSIEPMESIIDNFNKLTSRVRFNVVLTNVSEYAEMASVCGYVVDGNDNPVAWATRVVAVETNSIAECVLEFDGTLFSRVQGSDYRLKLVNLGDAVSDLYTWSVYHVCDVPVYGNPSSSDFAKKNVVVDFTEVADENTSGDLSLTIPIQINKSGAYLIRSILEGTNSQFVAAASLSANFREGATNAVIKFDGASIRRTGIDGPYQVSSIRVFSGESVVAQSDSFYITSDYKANDFGVEPTMLLVDGSSWQRESDTMGADRLIDELRFGIVATNTLQDAVAYRVHAILKGANNYPAAVHSEEVQLAPGENTITVSFSGSDILSSGVGGPYYVSEVSFSPAGEAGEEAYARINMEPLEIAEGAFGGKSFTITGEISVTESPGRGIAARVDIPLNVMRVGDVEASLLVIDTNGTCVATFSTNVTISATGEQTLELELSLDIILAYELGGGEYDIRALVLESANGNDSETIPFVCSGLVYRIGEEIFSYEENPDGVAITGVDKAIAGNLVRADIPESLGGRPVTGIETNAFRNCTNLVSVVIPDIVASIGVSAFYNCKSLTNVDIPASVTNIAVSAFRSSGVMSFFVDENNPTYSSKNGLLLSKDGKDLIIGSNGDVVIPDSVTSIRDYAFYECRGLTSVTIPNSVTSIGNSAFYWCNGLTSIMIPDSVTSIGDSVFMGCRLKSITIPQCLCNGTGDGNNFDIGESFFHLFSYSYASSASYYGRVWEGDGSIDNVEEIIISDTVTNIGVNAFWACHGLRSVSIGSNVTSIGYAAFYGCTNLTSVAIPAGVMDISRGAFSESGITSFVVSDSNPIYASQNGLLLSKDGKKLIVGVNGDVVIPDSVTSIKDHAFSDCIGLMSVIIGNSVTNIEELAFAWCTNLMSVTIPNGVMSIGSSAFYDCSSLTKITFMGDAPSVAGNNVFIGVNADCSAYVRIDSIGWGVEIPGTWNGIKIDYLPYETVNVMFNLYPGEEGFESESQSIPKDVNATLFLPTPKRKGHKFIGWFTEAEGGRMIVDGDVLSEDTTLYAHWEELLLLNTGTDNLIWDGTAINESNFDFMIPATEDLPAGTVVRINKITFASLNDSFTAWDVDTNKSDPYTVYLNGVRSDVYVFGGIIASNVGTLDNAISYTFSEPCDIVVGKRYPAVKGNNYGTVGNGVALLHSNYGGVLVYGGGADRASVRYVKTGDGNSIMSTPTAKQIIGVSGYHPVYEIQYDIVGVAPSGLDKLAFEYTATSANHTIKSIPDGWFKGATGFSDETIQKSNLRIGPGGDFKYALQTTASLSPWRDIDARTNAFSFALYADVSAMPSDAKAVMVAIGNLDSYSVILYRESGFVKLGFVDGYGGIVGETAGVEFAPGYHLYMASCDPVSGALTLNADGAVQDYGAAGGSVALGNGFQIGSVFYGCPYGFSKGANMAIVKMLGYDAELSASDIAALAAEYPAVESLVCNVGLDELDGKTLTVTTNQIARVVVTAEQEREGCEAANIYVKDGGNLVFVDEGGAELTRSRVAADGEMRSLIGSDSLGVKTDGDAVEVVESGGAYIITAVGDGAIDGGALSVKTALDGEIIDVDVNAGYVVKISVDGKSAVLSLRKPEIGYAVGEDDASSDDNDLSGVLVEVAEEKISAKPTVGDGEEVGALPVKAVRGLYYQAAWGDDLRELHPGEKVQAKDGQLYLGVIKQDGDRGFYRLSVSEK